MTEPKSPPASSATPTSSTAPSPSRQGETAAADLARTPATTPDDVQRLNDLLCARVAELDATQDRLAAAFRKLNQVREDERRKLAVGLHDQAVQQLIGAMWLLDEVDPHDTDPNVAAVRDALHSAVNSVRGVIHDLRPPSLDTAGLLATLEVQGRRVLGDNVAFEVVDDLPEPLPADLSTLIYRTMLEALRNVRKHAGASEAQVAVGLSADCVVARVRDNGGGFDAVRAAARAAAGHFGVESMREEIQLAGGRFLIGARSDGRAGTEVAFSLPLLPGH